ncbi:MAG: leucyl aminopeptidase, partial [Xanthobacteraceae bacterium]
MPGAVKIAFAPFAAPAKGVLVVFTDEQLRLGEASRAALGRAGDLLARAGKAERFAGKMGSSLDFVAPADLKAARLIFIGTGKDEPKSSDFIKLGGIAMGKIPPSASEATILADLPGGAMSPEQVSEIALGATLRAYSFDRYKTKRKEGEEEPAKAKVTIGVADAAAARRAWQRRNATAEGVTLARDLVNEPPNVLYPEEFARRASALKKTGVAVEVLDVKAMRRLGMNALLGVGRGSARQSRLVVMRWNGGKRGQPPLAFIGKGVTFDTGGISIKPAAGMEDMKWDMAGAGAVIGLMAALAGRKAKVDAVGLVGLVENMPSGDAQRPGDVVKTAAGLTVEVINTDAEGRLVLADVIHYCQQRFEPRFMVDLATLTGAIIVELGHEHAGMFSNDDALAQQVTEAGKAVGEACWRMPLGDAYDKQIKSDIADMKNVGGRPGGSI